MRPVRFDGSESVVIVAAQKRPLGGRELQLPCMSSLTSKTSTQKFFLRVLQDSIIATYEEHEDSVYALEWSSADPWLFASLSYDGRLVINRVPRALKYRILL